MTKRSYIKILLVAYQEKPYTESAAKSSVSTYCLARMLHRLLAQQ